MPTLPQDRYAVTPQQPLNPWQAQPQPAPTAEQLAVMARSGMTQPQPARVNPFQMQPPVQTAANPFQQGTAAAVGAATASNPQFGQVQPPVQTAGMQQPNALAPQGTRVQPSYLPENWDYHQSPEYQQRLAWAQRDLNRQLLSMGRSDSTGGINALARQQGEIAGQEIDKQYQRALAANMQNYGRYFGANVENYGRTRGEDETGWNRAAYLDNVGFRNQGRDFNQNYQLADLGYRATQTGVNAGNQAGANLANLLSQNGANQASLAMQQGVVSADQIQSLLNAGWTYMQIEQVFNNRGGGGQASIPSRVPMPLSPGSTEQATLPPSPVPNWSLTDPTFNQGQQYGALGGSGVDWFSA